MSSTIRRSLARPVRAAAVLAVSAAALLAGAAQASASTPSAAAVPSAATDGPGLCPPTAVAAEFSDGLDKLVYHGVQVGGLSDLAYDSRSHSFVSSVDNHITNGVPDPSRLWFYSNTLDPKVTRSPLVLRMPNGTAYDGVSADNEGLAVLPDGDFLVSSEVEPSVRIFGRDGVQKAQLPVPARFQVVTTGGEATVNATLEGLTVAPDGRQIVAAMEGTLSGDTPADGSPATFRRFLVYSARGTSWTLTKQVGYQVQPGNRISEVQEYADGKLLVMEAAFAATTGNTISLYAVTGLNTAPDVSAVANLSTRPDLVMKKKLVADVTKCPTLGATNKEFQSNPLMDNYEGMYTKASPVRGIYGVVLISDDNFSTGQTTRLLNLVALLP